MNQNSISQNFINLKRVNRAERGFSRKVQKGHTKGHKGQGQFADENVADDRVLHGSGSGIIPRNPAGFPRDSRGIGITFS